MSRAFGPRSTQLPVGADVLTDSCRAGYPFRCRRRDAAGIDPRWVWRNWPEFGTVLVDHLDGNIFRCMGYRSVVAAVQVRSDRAHATATAVAVAVAVDFDKAMAGPEVVAVVTAADLGELFDRFGHDGEGQLNPIGGAIARSGT
jgi:hypothetical protein